MEDRANILREMKICRFCLCNEESTLTNIYERQKTELKFSVPLPLQIMACSAIEVFKNDGMPQQICDSCRTLTMQAYTFKSNCKRADDALKVFLATGQLAKPYIQKVEAMQVTKRNPKIPRILSNDQFSKQTKSRKERKKEESNPDVIKLLINNKENSMKEENEPLEEISQDENSMEYDEEEGLECGELKNMDNSQFSIDEMTNMSNPKLKGAEMQEKCFSCPHCDRAFPLKQLLDLHVTNHSKYRDYECGECNKTFFTKYNLSKHFLTHTEEKSFSCSICKKDFAREILLKRHEEKVHKDIQKFECDDCGKAFFTQTQLFHHMKKHYKKKPFTCKICNKSFVFKQGLERHLVVHDENKPFKCNYCEASFNSAIKLARHVTSHAGLRPYPCKICNRTFLLSHHLTRHMRSHYAMNSSNLEAVIHKHKCDICSMSFRRKDSLINHSAIHSMVNLRCVICNTSFTTAQLVKEHITTHLAGLPFPCEKCDYSFETSEQLEEHELKHAEMEYEDQIEKEVIKEALTRSEVQQTQDDIMEDDDTFSEFTIPDLSNGDITLTPSGKKKKNTRKAAGKKQVEIVQAHQREKSNKNQQLVDNKEKTPSVKETNSIHPEQIHAGNYVPFLKDEVDSDIEEMGIPEEAQQNAEELDESLPEEIEPIKPIVRHEGTKVYQRKAAIERKIPEILSDPIRLSSLDEAPQLQDSNAVRLRDLSPKTLNSIQTKKVVDMKMGNKVVKVQKYIITKEEMKQMAKQGILEIKNGQVVLKSAGQPILNATLKPIEKTEIESLLEMKSEPKIQLKQYQKKGDRPVTSLNITNSTLLEQSTISESIDLDASSTDASQTTIQTD